MSRKDTSFYKKGNQIAGSLLEGWEHCESDPEGHLSHSPMCCLLFAQNCWLAGRPLEGKGPGRQ